MIVQERRLAKLETINPPRPRIVVRQIEPETLAQAWARQHGAKPMPPERDLFVVLRTFVSPIRAANVPAS